MANSLDELIAEVAGDLGKAIRLRVASSAPSTGLPSPLQELYAQCDGGDVGFGTIYSAPEAVDRQSLEPFTPDWVPFGDDGRGTFWLCAHRVVAGNWFTSWDHDSRTEIGEPMFGLVAPFLRGQYEERLAARSGDNNFLVLSAVPATATTAAALELKRLLGVGTASVLESLKRMPLEVPIRSVVEARAALGRLKASGVQGHLRLEFF